MIVGALTKVFRDWRYSLLATGVALFVFMFATWLPNIRLLFAILESPAVSLADKVALPVNLLGSIATNFSALSATYTIAIAFLTGINVALIAYYVQRRKRQFSQAGTAVGTLGVLSGVLGIGCAACGSLILTALLGMVDGASVLALLPLHGGEFGILGVLLLSVSVYLTAKQIQNPAVCLS